MTIGPSALAFKFPTISSRVKVTAAIGVLKAAAIPPALPTATRDLTEVLFNPKRRPILEPKPDVTATVGPSRPNVTPEERASIEAISFRNQSLNLIVPWWATRAILV